MAVFVYSSYWRTWSRLLLNEFNGECVEVNLTPANPAVSQEWERVKTQVIRRHRTPRTTRDTISQDLPGHVLADMKKYLSESLIDVLLTYDYLPEIDWAAYDKNCNGGAPFHKVSLFSREIHSSKNE